jgi:uncharacterized repeat protein (TIGR01451 family)
MAIDDLSSGVYFDTTSLDSDSGTGNYSTILRVQNTGEEQGFNSDQNGTVLDNKSSFTSAIQLSNLESVNIGGTDYFVIRFDLNQSTPDITLDSLQLYGSSAPATLTDYQNSTGAFGTTPIYTFSGTEVIAETGSGSGHDDGGFYIPVSLFTDAGLTGADYLTLYAHFTGANGGFEEFRALTAPGTPSLTVLKTAVVDPGDSNGLLDHVGDLIDYTVTVTNNGNVGLSDPAFQESLGITLVSTDSGGFNVGDANHNGVFDPGEAWIYSAAYAITQADLNTGGNVAAACGTFDNTVTASAHSLNNALQIVQDTDSADVQLTSLPAMAVDKSAEVLNFDNSHDSDQKVDAVGDKIAYSFTITNTGNTALHDVAISDPILAGDGITLDITQFSGDTNNDGLLDVNETWTYTATLTVTQAIFDTAVAAGDMLANTVTVSSDDCCGDPATGQLTDSFTVQFLPPVSTARTPGFWYNNGSLLWDGNAHTFPKGGNLGFTFLGTNGDLAYKVYDLNGDGVINTTAVDGVKDDSNGNNQYLMIGDWNNPGYADSGENVLVVSRTDALSLLNASLKQTQDGRYLVARDLVAAWLNVLAHTPAGSAQDTDSVRHYIDEGVAWLIQTTNGNHVLANSDLSSGTAIAMSKPAWGTGYDFGGTSAPGENMLPPPGSDVLGMLTSTDIMAGSVIHSGLDHFNNFGFI